MKIRIILCLMFVTFTACFAQSNLEQHKKEQIEAFQKYKNEQERKFRNYHLQQDSLFIQYKAQIEKLWDEFKESTPKDWVSYNEDFSGRSEVDFESGKVIIEAVESDSVDPLEAITDQIVAINSEKDDTGNAILKDQVQNPLNKNEKITEDNVNEIAQEIVSKVVKTTITGKDGKKRTKYSVSMDLVPNHIKIRADKYATYIEEKCNEFNIEPGFVLAIIHTESYFNPKAYNRKGNAYGMMQIVPKYAGINMNNYLYHKNTEPTSSELFDAYRNMEMGIAYMRWLADNKWQKVENSLNQYYCIICSYNGGPGTIYKAMTGKMEKIGDKKWHKMFDDLSTMESDKLYKLLKKKVPWEETRNYLKLVKERKEKIYKDL